MRVYSLCVGEISKGNYEIADVRAYTIEEAMVKAVAYLGWKFEEIRERF